MNIYRESIIKLRILYDSLCQQVQQKQEQTDSEYKQYIQKLHDYINKLQQLDMTLDMRENHDNNNDTKNDDALLSIQRELISAQQHSKQNMIDIKDKLMETLQLLANLEDEHKSLKTENEKLRQQILSSSIMRYHNNNNSNENRKERKIAALQSETARLKIENQELKELLVDQTESLKKQIKQLKQKQSVQSFNNNEEIQSLQSEIKQLKQKQNVQSVHNNDQIQLLQSEIMRLNAENNSLKQQSKEHMQETADLNNYIQVIQKEMQNAINSKLDSMRKACGALEQLRAIIKSLQKQTSSGQSIQIEKHILGIVGPISYHLVDIHSSAMQKTSNLL